MSDQASSSARSNPIVFTALLTAALAGAVLAGASLSGVASGAVQDVLRAAGFAQTGTLAAEQRRQAQALERIELSVGRVQADVALMNVRIGEAETLYREAMSAAPARPAASGDPASINAVLITAPAFDLGALRASFDGTVDDRLDARIARRLRAPHAERGAAIRARTAPSV